MTKLEKDELDTVFGGMFPGSGAAMLRYKATEYLKDHPNAANEVMKVMWQFVEDFFLSFVKNPF